jgi:8-oxo-dGTP diphosphatase
MKLPMPEFRPTGTDPRALLVVAAALVDAQGRVLMQQRPVTRQHGGLWEFPGGKLEPGEGPAAALVRELHEELAIIVASQALVPLGFAASEAREGARSVILLLFGCRTWSGQPVSQEGAICRWYDPEKLSALAMPPLDVPLARLARHFAQGKG